MKVNQQNRKKNKNYIKAPTMFPHEAKKLQHLIAAKGLYQLAAFQTLCGLCSSLFTTTASEENETNTLLSPILPCLNQHSRHHYLPQTWRVLLMCPFGSCLWERKWRRGVMGLSLSLQRDGNSGAQPPHSHRTPPSLLCWNPQIVLMVYVVIILITIASTRKRCRL